MRGINNKSEIILVILSIAIVNIFICCGCSSKIKDFDSGYERRMEVVKMVENGKLKSLHNGTIALPQGYEDLSDTGEIVVASYEKKVVIYFWTYRGILSASSGYLYFSDKLSADDFSNYGTVFVNLKDLGDGWYSCATE